MKLSEMIVPNKDFQTSVNIDFDFGSRTKVESLIPTDSVCRYLEEIIRDIVVPSNHRAKLLVGAYGKGKSHVVLAALTAMWLKDPASFRRIIDAYRERGSGFSETFEKFVSEGQRLLPVVISGSTADLRHSLLFALRNALKRAGHEQLMPQTNYDGALAVLNRWKTSYPDTLARFEELTGMSFLGATSRLGNLDTVAYEAFVEVYPQLTSGSTFDVLEGADVLDVYDHALAGLKDVGIDGMYVVYDEFSKYLETSIGRATVEDTKLLQDFAESCNRSSDKQLHLLLISHKSLSNYIDSNLPKEKVDGWRGVSGRFDEIEMADDPDQYYELMSNAIVKDGVAWKAWAEKGTSKNLRALEAVGKRYLDKGLFGSDSLDLIVRGCYPLHPLTAYLLPRLSEKVAQNERTLFTFLCSDGDRSFASLLNTEMRYIAPDAAYDYFEPLLRKEFYQSPLHRIYELAQSALARVAPSSLAARIVKTIASIDVVAQYDTVAPTRDALLELFVDCGWEQEEVEEALSVLVEANSVVYLRRSNSFLKLKETTGINIENEVSDRAEALRNSLNCIDILNSGLLGRALYPSRHNEEKGIVRYFDCEFVDASVIASWTPGKRILRRSEFDCGDGEIIAIFCASPDEMSSLKGIARDEISCEPMTVVVFPRAFVRIDDALYRLEAATQLKEEARSDASLAEEYEIVIEDYSEIVQDFIAGYFQPELGRSLYFIGGRRKNVITRKRRLSEELSLLCDATFYSTPRITSEALNKNELTGTAFSSRTKILKALCAPTLMPNLGFVGNGQETSIARSALEQTGLIKNIEQHVNEPGIRVPGMGAVIEAITAFVESADNTPFQELYEQLTGRALGIGLRRGPLPLYLAFVLRGYRDEIKITFNGEERQLNEELLDDISRQPAAYRLTRLNWSPQMSQYVADLAKVFGSRSDNVSRGDVAEALRLWFASLPQLTRNSRVDHTSSDDSRKISKVRTDFFKAIRRIDTDADTLLFGELPRIFGAPVGTPALIDAVQGEKTDCDNFLSDTVHSLAMKLKYMFDPNAHEEASLCSVLRDWVDSHPSIRTHVFSGVNNQILNAIKTTSGDDYVTVSRIAKAAISLRIDDWNDSRFADFMRLVLDMKREVEGALNLDSEDSGELVEITFIDERGVSRRKSFKSVEASGRSRLLKNNIRACLNEMGGAVTPEEKRQVVFEVLKELC